MTKLTREQIIAEVNSRPYGKDFRAGYMAEGLSPMDYILKNTGSSVSSQPKPTGQQATLKEIDDLYELNKVAFIMKASKKQEEFPRTCQTQWRSTQFTKPTASLASSVLALLREIEAIRVRVTGDHK